MRFVNFHSRMSRGFIGLHSLVLLGELLELLPGRRIIGGFCPWKWPDSFAGTQLIEQFNQRGSGVPNIVPSSLVGGRIASVKPD